MAPTRVDFLIAGQGLAGSLLAWNLLRHNQRVLVVDDHQRQASSTVAAGLVNPVTGMRLVKAPHAETLLPTALSHYRQLGTLFRQRFFHPRPMLRLFSNSKEVKRWEARRLTPEYRPWLGKQIAPGDYATFLENPLGGCLQAHTGYLDIPLLLLHLKDELSKRGAYRSARIHSEDCRISAGSLQWKDVSANTLVFCEGHQARFNPWFAKLPFRVAKGEILTLGNSQPFPRYIINCGRWLLPTGKGHFRFGATYERERLDDIPTHAARQELLSALISLTRQAKAFQLIQHAAGIRPATADTQPFIGRHPNHRTLAIFNGFGSKGSLLAPYCALRFTEHLIHGAPIPPWADISRYHDHLTGK